MVQIKLPDGSVKDYPDAVSPREVAQGIGKRLAEAAVAAVASTVPWKTAMANRSS
jgi:threonyl-tRNA synthetase